MSEKKKSKFTVIGEVRKEDEAIADKYNRKAGYYLKVLENITLKKGDTLQMKHPKDKYDAFVRLGKMSAEDAEEKKEKIPEYIRFEVTHVAKEE